MMPAFLGVMSRVAQFGINKLMTDEQNRYNSPAAQMARLKRAGLNPALLYQKVDPGLQNQAVRYPDSTLSKDIIDYYNSETNRFNAQTQRDVADADIELKKAQTKALQIANHNLDVLQTYIDKNPDSYYLPQANKFLAEYNKILADTRNVKSDTDLKEQQHEINRINQELYETKFWQDMEKGGAEIKNIEANTTNTNARTNLTNLDVLNYEARFLAKQKPWFLPLLEDIANKLGITIEKATDTINEIVDRANNDVAKSRYGIDYYDAKNMTLSDKTYRGNQVYKRQNLIKIKTDDGYIYSEEIPDFYYVTYSNGQPYFHKMNGQEIRQLK